MKKFIIGLLLGLLMSNSIVFAQSIKEYILKSVNYPIIVNGVEYKNDNLPILNYNGNTYVPLRAIGGMLGAEIEWNNKLNRVEIDSEIKSIQQEKISFNQRVFPDISTTLENYEKENIKLDFINFENNSAYIFKQINNQGLLIEFKNTNKKDVFVEIINLTFN